MACGEGYGSAVLAEHAAEVTGVDANPEAHEHARLRYARPGLRFERGLVEEWDDGAPWDAIVFLQTIEHVTDPAAMLSAVRRAARSGWRRVCQHAEPPHARAARVRTARTTLARARVHAPRNTATSSPRRSAASSSWASSMRASCAPTSWRCGWAGTARTRDCASRSRSIPASCRRSASATSQLRGGSARALAGPAGGVPAMTVDRDRGELCILLHSHMPYVEGFGTWPFGEEWLLEAMAASYLPLLGVLERHAEQGAQRNRHRRRHAGAGGPAGAARVSGSASWRSCAAPAASATPRTRAGLERADSTRPRRPCASPPRDYEHAARGLRAPRRRHPGSAAGAA